MDGGVTELKSHDWTAGADLATAAGVRAALSSAMMGIKKRYYGKGPVRARSYLNDRYVLCVLEGGLTRNEEILLAAGNEDCVRSYRLRFEAAVEDIATEAVEQITGRQVIGYHSQIVFEPTFVFEIFVLDQPPAVLGFEADGSG